MKRNLLLTIVFSLLSLFAVAQNQKGTVSGNVKTSDNGAAESVTVTLKGTGKVTQTDAKGNFTFKNVTPGNYTLKISAVGANATETQVTVAAGQNSKVDQTINETSAQLNEVGVSTYKTPNQKATNLGKSGIPAKDLPQAVQVITSQVIADQQANSLGDVMKNVNGVALGANRGSVGENFYARGYSLGSNNVLKNGARTTIGGSPEAATLESVEVLKGSAALLYGGVTGGAVVNMITKKPKFEYGGEVSMRTGSYGQYKPIVDVYGPISKKLAFRAVSTFERASSFRDEVKSKRFYINPSLLYKISDKTELVVQGDYLKSDFTPDFGIGSVGSKIVDLGRDKFLNTPWAYNNTNTATAQANFSHQFNDDWKVNVIGSYQSYYRNYFGAERIQADLTGAANRSTSRSRIEEFTFNQQVNITGKLKTAGITHTLLIGADGDESRSTSNAFNFIDETGAVKTSYAYSAMNVFDPTTYYGSGFMPQTFVVSKTLTPIYRYGAFVQDLIAITDKFKALAGVRYTYQKNKATEATNIQTGVVTNGTSKSDDAWSPKFGLIYEPLKTTSIYVSYANNFITNSGVDVYGAALPPSTVNQFEGGVKNDFLNGKLSANLVYYKIINGNIAQTAEFTADGVTPNADTNVRQLNGETTSDGLEIDLSGTILPGLNFIAGYAYNYMRYTNTAPLASHVVPAPTTADPAATRTVTTAGMIENVRLVGTTKNTANATLFYTFLRGKAKGLKLGASAFYTGARNGGWNDNKTVTDPTKLRLIPLSAFTTLDFSAGYTWNKFSILAKMSNITNELNYFVHENYSVNPIAPRQFAATLSYKF